MYDKQTVYVASNTHSEFLDLVIKRIMTMVSETGGLITVTDTTSSNGLYTSIKLTVWTNTTITIATSSTALNGKIDIVTRIGETIICTQTIQTGNISNNDTATERMTIIRLATSANEDAAVLRFSHFNGDYIKADIVMCKNSSLVLIAHAENSSTNTTAVNAMNASFYNSNTGLLQYLPYDRLGYIYPTVGQFEIMENKAFIENDTFRVQVDGLFDSTTISPDIVIMMDNKEYYSLDDHTIMEVTANAAS